MLVVIGLVVGGILVGRDLIVASEIRSQISQIQQYNTAANTFKIKFDYLPGDIPYSSASSLGLYARPNCKGAGNGDGLLGGVSNTNSACTTTHQAYGFNGESYLFWQDLGNVNLIGNGFLVPTSGDSVNTAAANNTATGFDKCFPAAKIGGNFIATYSGGWKHYAYGSDGRNYFSISKLSKVGVGCAYQVTASPGLTVGQAYAIDNKIDDSLPQSGKVLALYSGYSVTYNAIWSAGGGLEGDSCPWGVCELNMPRTTATPYLSTNCYDNNGVTGIQTYSMAQNQNEINCALSIAFQ